MEPTPFDEEKYIDELEKKKSKITTLLKDIEIRFADTKNYYTVLGVTKKSTPNEIKFAFETALQTYNINTFTYLLGNNNNVQATVDVFVKALNNAYIILSDVSNKYYYDNKDIIKNITDPDKLINQFIDGFVDDFDPIDKSAYWSPDELRC
jgi:hypothetical protein